jgi:hypothetical protein
MTTHDSVLPARGGRRWRLALPLTAAVAAGVLAAGGPLGSADELRRHLADLP